MKLIVKNKPASLHHELVEFKKGINGTYPYLTRAVKDDLLKALLEEQGYICGYCMQKINENNSSIEHIIGQSFIDEMGNDLGNRNQLNYDNLLAVCKGRSCNHKQQHCDKSRADYQGKVPKRQLFATPLEERIVQNIKFSEKGMIYYDNFTKIEDIEKLSDYANLSETENIKYDLQKVLNLNCEGLKTKRTSLFNALKRLTKNWTHREKIEKELIRFKTKASSQYEEMYQVAIYHLSKRLK